MQFQQRHPFLRIPNDVFPLQSVSGSEKSRSVVDEMSMQTGRWTQSLQVLQVTITDSHTGSQVLGKVLTTTDSHAGSQVLGKVHHRFVDVFL